MFENNKDVSLYITKNMQKMKSDKSCLLFIKNFYETNESIFIKAITETHLGVLRLAIIKGYNQCIEFLNCKITEFLTQYHKSQIEEADEEKMKELDPIEAQPNLYLENITRSYCAVLREFAINNSDQILDIDAKETIKLTIEGFFDFRAAMGFVCKKGDLDLIIPDRDKIFFRLDGILTLIKEIAEGIIKEKDPDQKFNFNSIFKPELLQQEDPSKKLQAKDVEILVDNKENKKDCRR